MKRIYTILAALFAVVVSSCTNDDIPEQTETIIRVNPATVISNFTYQLTPGELDAIDSNQQLRIRLYLFDENGNLYAKDQQTVRNYLNAATFSLDVPSNTHYTAVVVTDITDSTPGNYPEYWEISGEESLAKMRISYALEPDEQAYGPQEIIGIATESIVCGDNKTINVQPAGAIVATLVMNIHTYSDVAVAYMFGDRRNGYYEFSNDGSWIVNPDIDNSTPYIFATIPEVTSEGLYTYKFVTPQTNVSIFTGLFDYYDDLIYADRVYASFQQGKEYLLMFDFEDLSYSIKDVTGQSSRATSGNLEIADVEYQKISALSAAASDCSYRVIDLLKQK